MRLAEQRTRAAAPRKTIDDPLLREKQLRPAIRCQDQGHLLVVYRRRRHATSGSPRTWGCPGLLRDIGHLYFDKPVETRCNEVECAV